MYRKEMKCKWRHIRDNFLKYLNRGKSSDPAAKTKKYIYADALQFLLNIVEKSRTSGNIETTDSSETQGPSGNTVDEEEDHQVQPPSTSSGSGLQTPSRSASRQRQNERFTPFQSALLQKLDLTNTDQGDEDPDKIYILSLLSDYKKLNDDEKMDFKFLTLDFFRNAQRRRSSHYSGINTSMQNFPPSTQSSMYVFSQPGSRSTDFSYQLPPSSYPIQGPYPTPSPNSMQPPSPMHQSSPSPSFGQMQRPPPIPTPSPTSMQPPSPMHQSSPSPSLLPMQSPHPIPSPSPTSMQPPSPMHRSSPSPSLLPLQRPNPMTTPSPTSVQSQPARETTQHSFHEKSSESSTSMDFYYHH
ncbi:uncharacterized protein LOC128867069 [Anastrepha ludens]|uniref:uncharacterized protein LOC128867069 n=1 Tax=Anastrepha ludens TaxID=28586 RepID=UPI0023B1FE3C|nr:uncharacterized protein LOC128867069 [Anastrepha ludens]